MTFNELNQDSQRFITAFAQKWGKSHEEVIEALFRPLDPSYPGDTFASQVRDGAITHLNLFDRLGEFEWSEVPGLEQLKDLAVLNLAKTFIRWIDLSANQKLRVLHVGLSWYGQQVLNISANKALEELKIGSSSFNRGFIVCTDLQKKKFLGKARKGVVAVPEDQKKLFAYVKKYNWDDGYTVLNYIIRNPRLDKAIALSIYWAGKPEFFTQFASRDEVPKHSIENYDLIKEIEQKYTSGFYTESELSFDPKPETMYQALEE
jgi:hypothetical protein